MQHNLHKVLVCKKVFLPGQDKISLIQLLLICYNCFVILQVR